jgi:integrase/recombinase XerD
MANLVPLGRGGSIEKVTTHADACKRHYSAPLLSERERYIEYLLKRGSSRDYVRVTAGYMERIVDLMELKEVRTITHAEIQDAAHRWAEPACPFRVPDRRVGNSAAPFARVCRGWFSFLDKLASPQEPWFERLIQTFRTSQIIAGIEAKSIARKTYQIRAFLSHLSNRQRLYDVTLEDIESFTNEKLRLGWMPHTAINHCAALKSFFRFAATQGWCDPGIYLSIRVPVRKPKRSDLRAPSWQEVIRLIRSFKGASAFERRAKAMVMLCSYYGLRSIEVLRIGLDDIDWRNAVITIRRGKGGGFQQFPLLSEVGEAIIDYLKKDRPHVSSRLLFISFRPPYGQLGPMSIWKAVGPRLREIGSRVNYVGPHCLRHACASRLLHKGASLAQIKDYLGHVDPKSVDIYAQLDARSLRQVASFSLKDLL